MSGRHIRDKVDAKAFGMQPLATGSSVRFRGREITNVLTEIVEIRPVSVAVTSL